MAKPEGDPCASSTSRNAANPASGPRAGFDALVARILARFVVCAGSREIDEAILAALQSFAESIDADRAYAIRFSLDGKTWSVTHEWTADRVPSKLSLYQNVPVAAVPNLAGELQNGQQGDGGIATIKCHFHEKEGARSSLNVPISGPSRQVIGCVGVHSHAAEEHWTEDDVARLQMVGDAIAGILERRQTEEALRESEERFRTLVEYATHAVFVQADAKFAFVNHAGLKMLGADSREQLIGQPIVERIHPDYREAVRQSMEVVNNQRHPTPMMERVLLRLDGSSVLVEMSATPMQYQGKQGAVVFAGDISERKKREKERQTLEAQLLQAQKLEAIGQLAGGVAHDFNNVLTVIGGHVELTRQLLSPDHPAQSSLDTIVEAIRQASDVAQSLLTFSRRFEAHLEPISPASAIEETARLLRRLLPRSIELIVQAKNEPPVWVLADRVQLKQILLNLAINARDAMPEGGRLTLRSHVATHRSHHPEEAVIEVTDTGVGIAPDVAKRIFEPFFSTKGRGQGTGLGLSVVHGIAQSLGGRIEVASEPSKGSTFTLTLPCQPGTLETTTSIEPDDVPSGKGEVLLIADDHPHILRMLTGAMESLGYVVVQAGNGVAMFEEWRKHRESIRAIVSDIDMPSCSGLDALLRIREAGGDVPAVLVTGLVEAEYRNQLDGKTVVLRKPFAVADLAIRVRAALDAHEKELRA